MKRDTKLRMMTAALILTVSVPLVAAASAGSAAGHGSAVSRTGASGANADDSTLLGAFNAVDRNTKWTLTKKLRLNFPTYHTEGLAMTGDRLFLSAVEVLEPTVKYPSPQDGFDRNPGRGIGHVFVMDLEGNLQRDIIVGEGDMYHPAGLDFDGTSVWVPVAQYRPDSSSIIYRIDATSLEVKEQFRVDDHIGGIVRDQSTGHLVGNNWGSRRFYEWDLRDDTLSTWDNPSHFIDYQDCQYVATARQLCGGVTNLPQNPAAGGADATYELGGLALTDLRSHGVLHEVPFQSWSSAGHVATRNPMKMSADGNHLKLWLAPDDGNEGNGTELLTYEATVSVKS